MLTIAVCDDESAIRRQLKKYLAAYSEASGTALRIDEFPDGSALLAADFTRYDLMILDVQMGETNGIETARAIRRAGCDATIIFFTNYVHYAIEGYEVQAYRFLLKPLTYEQFTEVVGRALTELQERSSAALSVRLRDGATRVPVRDILYAETERGHVILRLKGGQSLVSPSTMKETEEALSGRFFRCHSAYLVSFEAVQTIGAQDVIMEDGTRIPVSKHRRKALREALALLWGEQFL